MRNIGLWKYCTFEHCKEMLLSFQLLGKTSMTDEQQIACLYAVSNHAQEYYHPVSIPKPGGGIRHLLVPDGGLKKIQKNLLHHLLEHIPVSSHATAYRKGFSIVSNAEVHTGKKHVLKLDLHDFFGNITYLMVYQKVFSGLYFPPQVRTLLTHLCCYKDYLPQGAPTSSAISNIVMRSFDEYIGLWCSERSITYTRYCDDMTFSGEFDSRMIKNKVESFLRVMGFELNEGKTRVLFHGQRQTVTGIVVNSKTQTAREYRKKIRQEIYYCSRFGVQAHLSQQRDHTYLPQGPDGVKKYLLALLGKIDYVLQVNPEDSYFRSAKMKVKELYERL